MSTRTVVNVDLKGYTGNALALEEVAGVQGLSHLDDQILQFLTRALQAANLPLHCLQASTGDGGILVFPTADEAHRFAFTLHHLTSGRLFRMGACTGEVALPPPGSLVRPSGFALVIAERLQSAAEVGELLVTPATYEPMPNSFKPHYGPMEVITAKHGHRIAVHRTRFATQAAPPPRQARPWWRRGLPVASVAVGLMAACLLAALAWPRLFPAQQPFVADGGAPPQQQPGEPSGTEEAPPPRAVEGEKSPARHGLVRPADAVGRPEKLKPPPQPAAGTATWPPKELIARLGDDRFRHADKVSALACSPDGRWVATTTQGDNYQRNALRLWDAGTGRESAVVREGLGFAPALAFSPDSRTLAVVSGGTQVLLWEVTAAGALRELWSVKRFVGAEATFNDNRHIDRVGFTADGRGLLAWDRQGGSWTWDLTERGPREKANLPGESKVLRASARDQRVTCETMVAYTEYDDAARKTRVWAQALNAGAPPQEVVFTPSTVDHLVLSADGKLLVVICKNVLRVWGLGPAGQPRERAGLTLPSTGTPRPWGICPDGRFLALSVEFHRQERDLRVVDLSDSEGRKPRLLTLPDSLKVGNGGVLWLKGKDGKEAAALVVCGVDNALRALFRKGDGDRMEYRDGWAQDATGAVRSVAFSPDGKAVAVVSREDWRELALLRSSLSVWKIGGAIQCRIGPRADGWLNQAEFCPDGRVLVCGAERRDKKTSPSFGGMLLKLDPADNLKELERLPFLQEVQSFSLARGAAALTAVVGYRSQVGFHLCDTGPLRATGRSVKTTSFDLAALSPDGRSLALSSTWERTRPRVRFLDVSSLDVSSLDGGNGGGVGKPARADFEFGRDLTPVALAYSPDGKHLATPTASNLLVWELQSGRERGVERGKANGVRKSTVAAACPRQRRA